MKSERELANGRAWLEGPCACTRRVPTLECVIFNHLGLHAMRASKKTGRWAASFVFATLAASAGAQSLNDGSALWIENQSFGFEACPALSAVPAAEDAQGTLAALRASATGDLSRAARIAGVSFGGANALTLTPVSGSFACGDRPSEVTFRIAAVDRVSGKYWTTDMKVVGDEAATTQPAIVALADQMTRSLRGVVTQASLR